MRKLISLAALVISSSACANAADNCHNTHTCSPPLDASVLCDGVCAPLAGVGVGWSVQPFLLWTGAATGLPDKRCPANAIVVSDQVWYAAPVQTLACPACSCAPSTGVCMLPETVTISPSPECPSDATDAGVPFDPPSDWDGGCTGNDAIAAVECDGGPCSATIGPMIPVDECMPIQPVVPKNLTWAMAAYTCTGTTRGACANNSDVCTPTPPEGFTLCVSRQGDDSNIQCPAAYPARRVFYLGGEDTRGCAPCGCEPPQGSSCASLVSLYADDACSTQIGSVTATSSTSMCVDIPAASSLGSKQASPPIYTAGSCQPNGGGETGSVLPADPFTFCSQK